MALCDEHLEGLVLSADRAEAAGERTRLWAPLAQYFFLLLPGLACGVSLAAAVDIGVWTILLVTLAAIAGAVFAAHGSAGHTVGPVWMLSGALAFVAGGLISVHDGGLSRLLMTHALPALAIGLSPVALWAVYVARGSMRNIPYALPIAVVVLFVPLFSAELWSVSEHLGLVRWGLLAVLTVFVLMLVVWLELRSTLNTVVGDTATRLVVNGSPATALLKQLQPSRVSRFLAGGRLFGARGPDDEDGTKAQLLKPAFASNSALPNRVRQVERELKPWFARRLLVRLTGTAVGIAAVSALYIYCLAALVIDRADVSRWITPEGRKPVSVAHGEIGIFGSQELSFPGGPYIEISILLGVVATAVFLAFVMTEEKYRDTLAKGLMHEPIERDLLLATAYAYLITPNDDFGSARKLSHESGDTESDTTRASSERDEPQHHRDAAGRSVWFQWEAPATKIAVFDARSSKFDTVLAVYTGTVLDALDRVATGTDPRRATFRAEKGCSYSIAVDGLGSDAWGKVVLAWEMSPLPHNDAFDDAEVLGNVTGSVPGDSTHATSEPDERSHAGVGGGKSLWYAWTAANDGTAIFHTIGSDFDTVLGVYEGSSMATLTEVVSNDDGEPGGASRVAFPASAGHRYFIAIDGYKGEAGRFRLSWEVCQPPPNDRFAQATPIHGVAGEHAGDTTYATAEVGEPPHAGRAPGRSIWFRWTPPASGLVAFDTKGSTFDTVMAVYTGDELPALSVVTANDDVNDRTRYSRVVFTAEEGRDYLIAVDGYDLRQTGKVMLRWRPVTAPANDDVRSARRIEGPEGVVHGDTTYATREHWDQILPEADIGNTVWYEYAARRPSRLMIAVDGEHRTALAAFAVDADDVDPDARRLGSGLLGADRAIPHVRQHSSVTFDTVPTKRYYVMVGGVADQAGPFRLDWASGDRPKNDPFTGALALEAESGSCEAENRFASREDGEPEHAGRAGGKSLWYSWQAPFDGWLSLDTRGSLFDTLLAVYTGSAVDALTHLASNDDELRGVVTSRVGLEVEKGVEYRIAVDGYAGASGLIKLNWQAKPATPTRAAVNALQRSITADRQGRAPLWRRGPLSRG